MPVVNPRIEDVFVAKQSAFDTIPGTPIMRGRKVDGGLGLSVEHGNELYSDGGRFPDGTAYVDSIGGGGSPALQAQASMAAYLFYLFSGQESVTGSGPYVHEITPGADQFWSTWWGRVGATPGQRRRFENCKMSSLRVEGSQGQKVLRLTPTVLSLKPGRVYTSDPVLADSGETPFLFTQATGAFQIGGQVFRPNGFAFEVSDGLEPWRGDDVEALDLVPGVGNVRVENVTILANTDGVNFLNNYYYGSTSPAANAAPSKVMPALSSFETTFTEPGGDILKIEIDGWQVEPPPPIQGNPSGGAVEITLSGPAKVSGANPKYRVTSTLDTQAAFA